MKALICAGQENIFYFTRHALRPAYLPIERILGTFNLGQSGCDLNQICHLHLHLHFLVMAVYFHVTTLWLKTSYLLCFVCLATGP
jgi:hypothetical protein